MALFILFLIILNCLITCLLGSHLHGNTDAYLKIVPSLTEGTQVFSYKVDDTLNISCQVHGNDDFKHNNIHLEWFTPTKTINSKHRLLLLNGVNSRRLIIENLQEYDTGEYTCKGSSNTDDKLGSKLETSIWVNIKKRKECSENMFQCSFGMCIHKRFMCDGYRDCKHGEDEQPVHCGEGDPCINKRVCPDHRCIPHSWCCESVRDPNCTVKVKHTCCAGYDKGFSELDHEYGSKYAEHRLSDVGFLQTTVYTVIGCAMAFMFIVTIIIIAICRVHMRRSLQSRYPAGARPPGTLCTRLAPNGTLNGLSFYDHLDLYLNRPGLNANDLMSVNPLLVTYNINNGVQLVGRPVEPPPYCEIVATPPKEGPPPPYASRENLCTHHCRRETELAEVSVEAEETESDALLGAAARLQSVSIISCNEMDGETSLASVCQSSQPDNVTKSRENVAGLDILILKSCEAGESSSVVSSEITDMSKGAISKILSTNSNRNDSPTSC